MENFTEQEIFDLMYNGEKNRDASSKISGFIYQDLVAIEKMLDAKVYLDLFIKVKPNWRVDHLMLDEFGYSNKD